VVFVAGGQLVTSNNTSTAIIGDGGVGTLTMSGGLWLGRRTVLGFGAGSQGTMFIAGGTNVLSESLSVGEGINGTGVLWVAGPGRLVVTNATTVIGARGTGQMIISNGTFLASSVRIATNVTASGTLTVNGGSGS